MLRFFASLVILMIATALPAEAAKRVALVIGNAKYTHVGELNTPPRDVRLIVGTLKGVGFDDVRLAEDLTNEQMRIALQEFSDVAASADIAIIYFAGHGIEVNNVNYLVPVDAKLEKAKDASFQAIKLDQFREAVSGAFKLRMVVLDACRNNPFRLLPKEGTRSLLNRGLVEVQPGVNELIAYSAQAGVVADDGPTNGNSPFAAALSKWIKSPGMDIRFVMGNVRDEVLAGTRPTEERDGPQIPYVESSLGGEQIVFNGAAKPILQDESGLTKSNKIGRQAVRIGCDAKLCSFFKVLDEISSVDKSDFQLMRVSYQVGEIERYWIEGKDEISPDVVDKIEWRLPQKEAALACSNSHGTFAAVEGNSFDPILVDLGGKGLKENSAESVTIYIHTCLGLDPQLRFKIGFSKELKIKPIVPETYGETIQLPIQRISKLFGLTSSF